MIFLTLKIKILFYKWLKVYPTPWSNKFFSLSTPCTNLNQLLINHKSHWTTTITTIKASYLVPCWQWQQRYFPSVALLPKHQTETQSRRYFNQGDQLAMKNNENFDYFCADRRYNRLSLIWVYIVLVFNGYLFCCSTFCLYCDARF